MGCSLAVLSVGPSINRRGFPQVTSKFELYSCFSPLVTKAGAIAVLTKLLRWLKKEEDWLFIRYPAPFTAAPVRPEGPEPEG